MSKKVLAIIPARGGSKSIYKKNIKDLCGKPMIAYTIETCLKSALIDRCIVSTDDEEIAFVAKKYGAEVPFLRPSEFAGDTSPDKPAFTHALDWLKENDNYIPDFILHLRPTSPFRTVGDIESVINIWKSSQCDSVRSVSLVDAISNPYWAFIENDKGYGEHYINDKKLQLKYSRRQDLPKVYKAHGLVDGYSYDSIYSSSDMLGENMKLHIVDKAIDIDDMEDFEYAEYLVKKRKISFD